MPSLPIRGLQPFSIPGYWRLWTNAVTGALSFTTVNLGIGWLVLDITDSVALVGVTAALDGLSMVLLSPLGGALADRWDRKSLLFVSQLAMGASILALGYTAAFDAVAYWHILLAVALQGAFRAVSMPARGALTYDLVGRASILHAETLQFLAFNISMSVGPLAGGFLLEAWGIGSLFLAIGVIYIGGTLLLAGLPSPSRAHAQQLGGPLWQNITEGLATCFRDRNLRTVVWVVMVTESLGFSVLVMLPVVTRDLLHQDASVLGLLAAAFGAGGAVGAITISLIGEIRPRAWVLMAASMSMGLFLLLFATRSTSLPLSVLLLFGTGLTGTVYDVMNGTLFQTLAPEHMRGRVLGIRSTLLSGSSMGAAVVGGAADRLGVAGARAVAGGALAINALRIAPVGRSMNRQSLGEAPVPEHQGNLNRPQPNE